MKNKISENIDYHKNLFIFGIFFVLIAMLYIAECYSCGAYENVTGIKTKYVAGKCYVNSGGKFIPYAEYIKKDVGNKIIVE